MSMPSVILSELNTSMIGNPSEPAWPDDVQLFQPFISEQILLPERANVTAVQAFLKMCQLHFLTQQRANAEFMSPSGGVPFIKCGNFVIADMDPIVDFVLNRCEINLSDHLEQAQKSDMKAYMALVNSVLYNAELYLTWMIDVNHLNTTSKRYSFGYPWPLNKILLWKKRRQITSKLESITWADKSLDEVYEEVHMCCQALAERLGTQLYFFGDKKTELDALVYGHVSAILMDSMIENKLGEIISQYPTLIEHCRRIDKEYFNNFS